MFEREAECVRQQKRVSAFAQSRDDDCQRIRIEAKNENTFNI